MCLNSYKKSYLPKRSSPLKMYTFNFFFVLLHNRKQHKINFSAKADATVTFKSRKRKECTFKRLYKNPASLIPDEIVDAKLIVSIDSVSSEYAWPSSLLIESPCDILSMLLSALLLPCCF